MPVGCIHLDNYIPLFKISVGRSRCREPVYKEINKSRVLETHPPKWKCYKLIAQESNRRLGSAQLYQRKKSFSFKITTKISVNISITSRILLLVTFIMALKGAALYCSQFKVSVTQSYYNIHYRNTIYQPQICAWTNLGFHFLVLWQGA